MDIGKSFSYPFEDNDWLSKLFIGAVISAVPILNFAWLGYIADLLKNVMDGAPLPLPDWSDLGNKFVKGLLLWLAGIIYLLPLLIVACIGGILFVTIAPEEADVQDTIRVISTGVGLVIGCLFLIYAFVLSFYFPAVYINFARKGTFGSCFEFGEITKIVSANISKYLTAWLITIVAGIVVGVILGLVATVVGIIPCVGWIIGWLIGAIGGVYTFTIFAHLFGQVASTPPATMLALEI